MPSTELADPMFVVPDPFDPIYSDSPAPLPYDRRAHDEILIEASARLRRNSVAPGGYWKAPDGALLTVDDDVSDAPTCLLGALVPLGEDGIPKIKERGQMPRTTPQEVRSALRRATAALMSERHPNTPSYLRECDKLKLSRTNDWLVEHGFAAEVVEIVDAARERL